MLYTKIMDFLVEERYRQGLTQKQLAKRIGIHRSHLAKYETFRRLMKSNSRNPMRAMPVKALWNWANALGFEIGIWEKDYENPERNE